ncbi:hypothetical protein H072_3135 [Dactylellina haptotyla CBS 200.50]|uniref:proline--tRNA ligase n=1 Tax=Dactylellina haptotyla (strain CBS 200.50) TaxID=1284197 RepID=S8AIN1_DACHA|nr:hypothetical protein H072_3135 [Dactylellina haptotyla CBS 200.50]
MVLGSLVRRRPIAACARCSFASSNTIITRRLTTDGRTRISNLWLPIPKAKPSPKDDAEDVHSLLLKAGYVRNAYPGVFHMLPFGLRVQEKIEKIIDKNMKAIGASKAALPSISSHSLWQRTGRADKMGKELFQLKDRQGSQYLLGPTHEEEITTLVSSTVTSYKQLPLRVYQTTRKYRDERRPRAGLLRGREFVMKDLYTFDSSADAALSTYSDVVGAYKSIFDELSLPYLVAEADSGNMGGNLSHEYHYNCNTGEDTVIKCSGKEGEGCGYTANVECLEHLPVQRGKWKTREVKVWYGVSKDRKVLVKAYYPGYVQLTAPSASGENEWFKREVNPRVIQSVVGDEGGGIETGMEEASALNAWEENFTPWVDTLDNTTGQAKENEAYSRIIKVYDGHILDGDGESKFTTFSKHEEDFGAESPSIIKQFFSDKKIPTIVKTSVEGKPAGSADRHPIFLCKPVTGDSCPKCVEGGLTATKTTELGHTFYLGTRYSEPLKATVGTVDEKGVQSQVNMQMGCYGIGVTRLIAAIAELLKDEKGLCWPNAIAPYSIVIVYTRKKGEWGMESEAAGVYDAIAAADSNRLVDDIVLDDREESVAMKMKEADLVGYSVVVVLGSNYKNDKIIEVQERRTGRKHKVKAEDLHETLQHILP